ncbi:MAG: 3-(3-hydroxy-phenyl)propionate hydroxylase [Pseudonocardiales bacterium]|nr:3-(3-hydroxy-phenyl)propionate hydroxylase [Pseudonocardiales bacterium]
MPHPSVVVVGAGPVGITVATLLAQYGVTCTVVDRHTRPYPMPRAVHLDGAAVRVLQQLGLADEFAAISRPANGLRLLDARLRPFVVVDRDTSPGVHGHPEANLFDQPALEALLRSNLSRHPEVTLHGGTVVTAVEQDGDAAVVTVQDTATGAVEQWPTRAVLGCDGAESTVRSAIGAHLDDLGFAERWFVVDVRCPRTIDNWGGVDQVCDPRRAATFMHLAADRYRWEFRMQPDETPDDLGRPDRLAALVAPWTGGLSPAGWTVLRSGAYTFRAAVTDQWRRGPVMLVGDAAHLTPPFIGQGLGLGLGDAHNLAWKLAAVLRGDAGDDLLTSYGDERGAHARDVVRTGIRVGRAMTGGQGVVAALRRPIAATLLRLPGVRARAAAALTTRYPSGPWVDDRRRRGDLSGTACPQPFVRRGGRTVRLDDVLGPGFALITTGPIGPALRARSRAVCAREITVADGSEGTIDDGRTLRAWLRTARTTAVLLRPDRIVMATDRG